MTDKESNEQTGSILDKGGVDTDARAGRSLGIDLAAAPKDTTEEELAAERERRLDPENRPDGAEVDNTERTFDHERGQFTDSEAYDQAEPRFSDPEDPNNPDNVAERS